MFTLLALKEINNSPLVVTRRAFLFGTRMIKEWINRVLNRSLKTTKFGDNKEVDWSEIPMTTVPEEFKERINAERVREEVSSLDDTPS